MTSSAMKEEEAIASVYRSLCLKNDLLLDIGANYGYHTRHMAEVAYEGSVICLEAHPEHAARLTQAYAESSTVQVINKALVPETIANQRTIAFRISEEYHGRGGIEGLHIWKQIDPSMPFHEITVETISLDSLLSSLAKGPSFIKMDIEGPEYSILGSTRLLGSQVRPACIAFENSEHGPSLGSINFKDLCNTWAVKLYTFISMKGLVIDSEESRRSAGQTLFLCKEDIIPQLQASLHAFNSLS